MLKTDTKELNLAEKTVLVAVFVAILVSSSRPNVTQAAPVSLQAFETPTEEVSPITIKKTITVVATAYSSTPDQTDSTPFITSNGKWVYDGLIAVNGMPYNTKIRIPEVFGEKVFTVNDRMNARYDSSRIDIWMETREAAIKFGAKRVRIQIVE